MYIEKRKSKGGIKYYLGHSYREGKLVSKIRKYLGQDLKPEKLAERRKIAEKLIIEEIYKHKIISDPLQVDLSEYDLEWIKKIEAKIPLKISYIRAGK